MIINSNYRQPYDGLQGMGQDKRVVWNRVAKTVVTDSKEFQQLKERFQGQEQLTKWFNEEYILIKNKYTNHIELKGKIEELFKNLKEHSLYLKKYDFTLVPDYILICAGNAWLIYKNHIIISKHSSKTECIQIELPEDYSIYNKLLDCPIVIIGKGDYIWLNPDIYNEFGGWSDIVPKINPYDLYQKVFAFLSPKDPEPVEALDKYKVLAHGMDDSSFRRDKGGPTRKRKNKQ